jgi:hypothetical protein
LGPTSTDRFGSPSNRRRSSGRYTVLLRKITGGNRSPTGAESWAKLASLLRTADQQQLGVYAATVKLIKEYWEQRRR